MPKSKILFDRRFFFFVSWLYNLFDSYVDKRIKETLQDKVKYSGSDGLCQQKFIT